MFDLPNFVFRKSDKIKNKNKQIYKNHYMRLSSFRYLKK